MSDKLQLLIKFTLYFSPKYEGSEGMLPNNILDELDKAIDYKRNGEYKKALDIYKEMLIPRRPDHPSI